MPSMMKKAMIYLGLGPDEEYEQYDEYAAPAPAQPTGSARPGALPIEPRQPAEPRPVQQASRREQPLVHPQAHPDPAPSGTVRPLAADDPAMSRTSTPAPEPAAAVERAPVVSSAVRTIGPASAKPHAVSPTSFNDAQEIGDRFKTGQPVIVNLQAVDRDLRRRLVDFASGLCYAIEGKMERVADQVYLLTPADVEVSAEETRRHID